MRSFVGMTLGLCRTDDITDFALGWAAFWLAAAGALFSHTKSVPAFPARSSSGFPYFGLLGWCRPTGKGSHTNLARADPDQMRSKSTLYPFVSSRFLIDKVAPPDQEKL